MQLLGRTTLADAQCLPLPNSHLTSQVTLLEQLDPAGVPISVLLGTVAGNGLATPTLWMDPVS